MRYNRHVHQSNRGMVMVVGGGMALGLVLALGYVFYWSPKLKADAAKDEIRVWGQNWQAARTCLLGTTPYSSDATEAMLARELLEAGLDSSLDACVPKIKALRRQDGASSENMTIEKAWYDLRVPIAKVAQEHAWRTARTPNKSAKKLRLNLAKSIATLDASYAALRRSASLKADPAPGSPLAKAEVYLELKGPDGIAASVTELRLRSDAVTYTIRNSESTFRAKIAGGTNKAKFSALSPLALRAVDAEWGLWVEEDGIPLQDSYASKGARVVTGPLDVQGEPGADGVVLHTLAANEQVQLRFATGSSNRSVLYRILQVDDAGGFTWSYRLLASTDTGATWTPHDLPQGDMWPSLKETSDTSYIVSTNPNAPMTLQLMTISDAGIVERSVTFPKSASEDATWPPHQCLAGSRVWWVLEKTLYTMGPGGELVTLPGTLHYDPDKRTDKFAYQFLCGDSYAAVHAIPYVGADQSLQYQACNLEGCAEVVKSTARTGDAIVKHVFHDDTWYTVQELDGLVALWRGGNAKTPERLLQLTVSGELEGVVSWGDALVFVVWPEDADAPTLLRAQ